MSVNVFDRLVDLVREREDLDPLTSRYAYLSGRIDECCLEHGIADTDRERAVAAVAAALRSRASRQAEAAA